MNIKDIISLTQPVSDDSFSALLKIIKPFKCAKGEIVMQQGKICNDIFVVEEGVFRNFMENEDGEEITRWFAEDGDIFTSMLSFSRGEPSIASVNALCNSSGWTVSIPDARNLITDYPEWSRWATKLFIDGLAVMERRYKFLGTGDAYTRFQNFYKWRRQEVINLIPLQDIASYLGVTPQSISRFRRKLTLK